MKNPTLLSVLLAAAVAACFAGPALAWESDKLFEINYFHFPATELKKEEAGKIEMNSAQAAMMAPLSLGESTFAVLGFDYLGLFVDYRDIEFSYSGEDGTFTQDDLPEDLHALDLITGFMVEWDENWATYLEFRPGLHYDGEDVDEDDIYYQGGAIISYGFSEDFILSLGGFYCDEFGEPELIPLLGVQWQISDVFAFDALLPDYCLLSARAASWLKLGLKGKVKGHQFRLTEKSPWKNTVIKYSQILAGPYADVIFWENLVLRVEGGIATERQFEFRDDDSSEKLYDGDMDDETYGGVSLSYQF